MKTAFRTVLCLTLGVVLLPVGCTRSESASSGAGNLQVRLTDAPLDLSSAQSVNVTITGVTVYPKETVESMAMPAEPAPIILASFPSTFDLLTLTGGATALLASAEVPVGDYSRIRLEISDATLLFKDGTAQTLKVEPGKVDVPISFHVSAGPGTTVTLDFDAAASVQVNDTASGQLILRPVVTPMH